jgi:hemerythrin-like domain-containing protein
MSRAIDDLLHEHDAILFALGILDDMVQRVSSGQPSSTDDIAAFLGFLKEFADKCHHGKEEGFLFPALTAAGIPEQGGPVGVMLHEHAQGREAIAQMEASLHPTLDLARFTSAARGYADLLRAHIDKENTILFPMAEKALLSQQLDELFEKFEGHEENVIGAGRHEELHGLLKGLRQKYRTEA